MQHLLHSRTGVWRRNDLNETMIIMVTVDLLSDVTYVLKGGSFSMMGVKEVSRFIYFKQRVSLLFPLTELSVVLLHQ